MPPIQQHLTIIIDRITNDGYAVIEHFFTAQNVAALAAHAQHLKAQGLMRKAATGLDTNQHKASLLRGDFTHWIEASDAGPIEQTYLEAMDALQQALNQAFFLGLFELESHFAIYPTGTGYQKHLDQFIGKEDRKISCILYLNEDWQANDGGELRIYLDKNDSQKTVDIAPTGGKLVVFVSSDFLHEVLPAKRERISITGWFRTRSTQR